MAVILGGVGVLAVGAGASACGNVYFTGGRLDWLVWAVHSLPYLCIAVAGVVWCASAMAFLKARWRRACTMAALGPVSYGLGIIVQMAILVYDDWLPRAADPRASLVASPENSPGTLTRVGDTAPDFEVTTTEGRRFRLSDLRGQVVVVCFFATWCGPCRLELPQIDDVWKELTSDRFAVVAIAREEDDDKVQGFRTEHGLSLPMAADPNGVAYQKYATKGVPRTYVVAADGTIAHQFVGYFEEHRAILRKVIQKELARK